MHQRRIQKFNLLDRQKDYRNQILHICDVSCSVLNTCGMLVLNIRSDATDMEYLVFVVLTGAVVIRIIQMIGRQIRISNCRSLWIRYEVEGISGC